MDTFLENRLEWITGFVPVPFRGKVWDDFPADTPERLRIREQAEAYAGSILDGAVRSLLLYGPPGRGKTFLAALIWQLLAMHVADRMSIADAVAAGTADNLAWIVGDDLPKIAKPDVDYEGGFRITAEHVETAFFCVLDDADKCPVKWGNALFSILNSRLWANTLPTIITMNSTPAEFVKRYGDVGAPIWSRIQRSGALVIRVV